MVAKTVCVRSLRAPHHLIAILETKIWQKVDNLEPVYFGNFDIDEKKFRAFERTTYSLFHSHVNLFRLGYNSTFFFFFSFFSSITIYF